MKQKQASGGSSPTIGIGETGLPSLGGTESESTVTRHTETIHVAGGAATAERPLVVVVKGIDSGRLIPIGRGTLTIGRAADSALPLPDRGISHKHAKLTRSGGTDLTFLLEDLGSKNGTWIGGEKICAPCEIRPGDTFQIGPDVLLRLVNMTEAEENSARQLYNSSMTDALTGAFNHRYFSRRLKSELAFANRHQTPLSIVVFNYDHFKNLNDEHGQSGGDLSLYTLTRTVQGELRTEDVLSRIDNEQFAVLLRGIDESGALRCAERIRAAVATKTLPIDPPTTITVSLGVATSTEATTAGQRLVELATARLFAAKSRGRNCVGGPELVPPE